MKSFTIAVLLLVAVGYIDVQRVEDSPLALFDIELGNITGPGPILKVPVISNASGARSAYGATSRR